MSKTGTFSTDFLDHLPDNVLVTDDQGTLIQANSRAREAFALKGDLGGMPVADLFPFRSPDQLPLGSVVPDQIPFEDIARSVEGREFRTVVRVGPGGPDRRVWLVSDLTSEQADRQGMIDFMADLTTAQAKIREYTRQIEVFRKIVNGMDQGIVLSDPDQKVAFSNAFANTLFGTELTGKKVADILACISSASVGLPHESLKGEVLVLDEIRGRQTRCYLNVAPLSRDSSDDRSLVWTFFELTEEIANTQAFIDFSAELALLNRDLRKKNEEILHLSRTDVLTGVANRRSILDMLERAVGFDAAQNQGLAVALFDIDRFKDVNDKKGHLVGDEVLRQVCRLASEALDQAGTLGRYGGEEFLAVLPGADGAQAKAFSEEMRVAVQRGTEALGIPVTITIGVSVHQPGSRVDELLSEADRALYKGKASGRNQVVLDE